MDVVNKRLYLRNKKQAVEKSKCDKCICNECSMNYVTEEKCSEGICIGCEMCLGDTSPGISINVSCPIGKNTQKNVG